MPNLMRFLCLSYHIGLMGERNSLFNATKAKRMERKVSPLQIRALRCRLPLDADG